jgi:WD40 repeat protein
MAGEAPTVINIVTAVIQTISSTMATSHSNKRHKTCPNDAEASLPIQAVVDVILDVNREAFKEFARNLDRETFKLLSSCLSGLSQSMEDTLTKFADIPPIVIASNVFPHLENRTDWNNFSLVNKDINKAVTSHKGLAPPWPEGKLTDASMQGKWLWSPTFSADGKCIAHGDDEGNIYLWSRTKGLIANWQGHDNIDVNYISFSPAGNLLVTVGDYSNIKIWDLANNNRCLREWTQDNVFSVAFSPDGQVIASSGGSGGGMRPVYLRNVSDGMTARLITQNALQAVFSVVFSPDGRTLALGGYDVGGGGSVKLWKVDNAEDTSFSLDGHFAQANDLAYSPDGTLLASAFGKTIRLWDVSNRQCVRTLLGHTGDVNSISFTPDGSFLASGGHGDHTIRLWSAASGNCIECIETMGSVFNVEYSPDSRMLLTREGNEIHLRVMDTDMLEELQQECGDLMKLSTDQLQQALYENDIEVHSDSATKVALVDHLMQYLDRNKRKEIIMEYSKGP